MGLFRPKTWKHLRKTSGLSPTKNELWVRWVGHKKVPNPNFSKDMYEVIELQYDDRNKKYIINVGSGTLTMDRKGEKYLHWLSNKPMSLKQVLEDVRERFPGAIYSTIAAPTRKDALRIIRQLKNMNLWDLYNMY